MKRVMKVMSSILCVTSLVTMFSFSAFATNTKDIKLDKSDELDKIVMESDSYKKLIKEFPESKVVSKTESYVKVETSKALKEQKKTYTKEEYIKEVITSQAKITKSDEKLGRTNDEYTRDFGWIKTSLLAMSTFTDYYQIQFTYQWLQKPRYTLVDAIVLGADSNFAIDTQSLWLGHHVVDSRGVDYGKIYTMRDSEIQCRGANTYGANVSINIDDYTITDKVYGSMSARGLFVNTYTNAAKYYGSYGHRQPGLQSDSFSFDPTTLKFNFNFQLSYDEAGLSYTMYR